MKRQFIIADMLDTDPPVRFRVEGRDAWALSELLDAGDAGCTPITHPGPRWSGYVFNLRQIGLDIETVHEAHSGPFPGHHARYVLRARIRVVQRGGTAEAA